MANTKIYTVIKDGETVKELKTLTAAKKLADEQGGEVLCEGETVYTASSIEPQAQEPVQAQPVPEKYTLTARMNVRTAPSLDAPKLGVAQAGTEVEVATVENDWLHLTNGAYILYGDGKFAKKND
jgi:uncharacterized protein YgiM (DUF1202 family)